MRIKKTSQYIEGGASLSNVYGTSDSNGYTQEYINGLETYSTTEQRIGTWIDGKPIYRKVVGGTVSTNIYIESSGVIDTLINVAGMITKDNVKFFVPAPPLYQTLSNNMTDQACRFIVNNGSIRMDSSSDFYTGTYQVAIEYTKTTD